LDRAVECIVALNHLERMNEMCAIWNGCFWRISYRRLWNKLIV